MSARPITRVFNEAGELVHDCEEAGCEVSWDGYPLGGGAQVEGATQLGDEWHAPGDGTARPVTG